MYIKTLFIVLCIFWLSGIVLAQNIPPPIPNTMVQDHAKVFNEADNAEIKEKVDELKAKYNIEIGVATVETTDGYDVGQYGLQMARQYGVGPSTDEKRGILILLATKDRHWTIQISRHMEAVITDGQSGSIGRQYLVPKLKIASKTDASSDWKDAVMGTLVGLDAQIQKNIEPEVKEPAQPVNNSGAIGIFLGGLFGLGLIGGGIGLVSRSKRKHREAREAAQRAERQAEMAMAVAKQREWERSPEGKAQRAREYAEEVERQKAAAREKHKREAYLKTPEGKREEAARLKRLSDEEDERRARRRREEESSYSSSSYSSGSSYDSGSSSSSDSGGFGGGGDFGGGGSSGSW